MHDRLIAAKAAFLDAPDRSPEELSPRRWRAQSPAEAVDVPKARAKCQHQVEIGRKNSRKEVGMSQTPSADEGIETDALFEELKLVDEFVPAHHAAVLRTLAVERAIMGEDPDWAKNEHATQWFLDAKGIERPNLALWLASNDLGSEGSTTSRH